MDYNKLNVERFQKRIWRKKETQHQLSGDRMETTDKKSLIKIHVIINRTGRQRREHPALPSYKISIRKINLGFKILTAFYFFS